MLNNVETTRNEIEQMKDLNYLFTLLASFFHFFSVKNSL